MTGFSAERLFERVMVAASAFVLLGTAAVLDDRVRDRASGVFAGSAMSELTMAREHVARALQQAANTVGYQSNENGTLMFFVVAATILFVLVIRT
ncbi:MAG: hypothetical protein ABIS29_02725 [Vicinamibacterales bacterium]